MLGNSLFFLYQSFVFKKRYELKNLFSTQSKTFLALSISLLVSMAILETVNINQKSKSPGSPSFFISQLSKSLEQQSTKKCLLQKSFSFGLTPGTTLSNMSSTCSMLIRCGSISAYFKKRINETAVIFLFCNQTSLWVSSTLFCLLRLQ